MSNDIYNKYCNLAFVCPITSTINKHPFRILLDDRTKTHGSILCEQLKALDLTKRNAQYEEMVSKDIIEDVLDLIKSFME